MSSVKGKKNVSLPRIPLGTRQSQTEFWAQKSDSGALHAFRQLGSQGHRSSRRPISLPGSKLQPLFKNHTAPPGGNFGQIGRQQVLPNIQGQLKDAGSTKAQIMCGNFDDIPDSPPNVIRVYLCSNYEDMVVERNTLLQRAVPEIQEFCSELGLSFQLVDLNWGVPQDNSRLMQDVRNHERAKCQRLSIGPNFVLLLGDCYGQLQLPRRLTEKQFEILSAATSELDHADLLAQHYFKDTNAVPTDFVLKPSTDTEELTHLMRLIKDGAKKAVETEQFSSHEARKLYWSAVEEDVTNSVFSTKDPRSSCLCYQREFQGIENHIGSPGAATFIETRTENADKNILDEERRQLNRELSEKLFEHLGVANKKSYYLPWRGSGKTDLENDPDIQNFLTKLCEDFTADMKYMITQGVSRTSKTGKRVASNLYLETLNHAHTCKDRVKDFVGQETLLRRVELFLKDPRQNNKAFVIHGTSGSGKTTCMAKVALKVREWFGGDCVVVVRFLNMTSDTIGIFQTIRSVTLQICQAYDIRPPSAEHFSTLFKAMTTFRSVIERVSQEYAFIRPLILLLDGIEQLQPIDESLQSLWAIKDLPPNVHLVVSTLPQLGKANLLQNLTSLVTSEDAGEEVGPLSQDDMQNLVLAILERHGRTITDDQMNAILNFMSENPNLTSVPLTLKHIALEATKWNSAKEVSELNLQEVEAFLSEKFSQLESLLGTNVTSYALGYLTVPMIGVIERDMVDLLSCRYSAMSDVYDMTDMRPEACKNIVQFPAKILSGFLYAIRHFLEERLLFGTTVLGFGHRVYNMVVADNYGLIFAGIEQDRITEDPMTLIIGFHEHFANMYLPEKATDLLGFLQEEEDSKIQAGHLQMAMPQKMNMQNLNMFYKLPFHLRVLVPVEGLERVKEVMFFNYHWLMTKLKVAGVHSIIQDLIDLLQMALHLVAEGVLESMHSITDLRLLLEFFQLAKPSLILKSDNLSTEMTGRLSGLTTSFPNFQNLLNQANDHVTKQAESQMSPLYPCLVPPGEKLRYTLEGPTHLIGSVHEGRTVVVFSQSKGVALWKLETGEYMHQYPVNAEQHLSGVIPSSQGTFILIGHYSHVNHLMNVGVWSTFTGIQVVEANFPHKFEFMALDKSSSIMLVSTLREVEAEARKYRRHLVAYDIQSKEEMYTIPVDDVHEAGIDKIFFLEQEKYGANVALTIGNRDSQDIAMWNLDEKQMVFQLALNCYVDLVLLHEVNQHAVCGSSQSGIILVVDLNKGEIHQAVENLGMFVGMNDLYVSNAGDHALVATSGGTVYVHCIATGTGDTITLDKLPESGSPEICTKITMDKQEHFAYFGMQSGKIMIYILATRTVAATLDAHCQQVNSLLPIEPHYLCTSGDDGIAKGWNLSKLLLPSLYALDVSSWDGKTQFEGVAATTAPTSSPEDMAEAVYPSIYDDITSMTMSANGRHVMTAQHNGPIKVWDVTTGHLVKKFSEGCEYGVSELYLACRGKVIVGHSVEPATTRARRLQVWNAETGKVMKVSDEGIMVYTSCPSPDGEKLLTISPSTENKHTGIVIGMYDLFELKCLTTLHCNIYGSMDSSNLKLVGMTMPIKPDLPSSPSQVSLHTEATQSDAKSNQSNSRFNKMYAVLDYFPSPDMSFFFSITIKGSRLDQVAMEHNEPVHMDSSSPQCTCILEDGYAATGRTNGSISIWHIATQEEISNIYDTMLVKSTRSSRSKPAHEGKVTCVQFFPGNYTLVTGGTDGKVKLWNMKEKVPIPRVIAVTKDMVLGFDLLIQEELLVTASSDKKLCLASLSTGANLSQFFLHADVHKVLFSKDAKQIVCLAEASHVKRLVMMKIN